MAKLHQSLPLLAVVLTLAASAFPISSAIQYDVYNNSPNTPGGIRFNSVIGIDYTLQVLADATSLILDTLYFPDNTDVKDVQQINCTVDDTNIDDVTDGNIIHLSTNYIARFSGNLKKEVTGILFHDVARVWQWDGQGQAPIGLVNGVADYVRLKAGYEPDDNIWLEFGAGDRWDQGYGVTAKFLMYCNLMRTDFVNKLNSMMQYRYDNNYFEVLLQKSVFDLFDDYKAFYTS